MPAPAQPVIVRSAEDIARASAECLAEPAIGVALTTTGSDPLANRISEICLATPGGVWRIGLGDLPYALELAPLRDLLSEARPVKAILEAKSAVRFLAETGVGAGRIFDPQIAAVLAGAVRTDSDARPDLLASHYLGSSVPPLPDAPARAALALALRRVMVDEIVRTGLVDVARIEMACVPALARMEHAGLPFDREAWAALSGRLDARRDSALASLTAEAGALGLGVPANPRHEREWLATLKAAGIAATSTQADHLEAFADRPIVSSLLAYKKLCSYAATARGGLLDGVHPLTGRLHGEFVQMGTLTGRIMSRNPPIQNVPKAPDFRECIRAGESRAIIVADCSQMELRILAHLSGDEAMRDAFRSGQDLHRAMASRMNGISPDAVTVEQRSAAKAVSFGIAYGMSPAGLAAKLRVGEDSARALIEAFYRAAPAVRTFLLATAAAARESGRLTNPLGRIIRFTDAPPSPAEKSRVERQARNAPMQSTNADAIKHALAVLDSSLAAKGGRIINCVHDEIVVEGPRERAAELAQALEQGLVDAVSGFIPSVPVAVDVHVSADWGKPGERRLFGPPARNANKNPPTAPGDRGR